MIKSLPAIPLLLCLIPGRVEAQPIVTEHTSIGGLVGLSVEANTFRATSTVGLADITNMSGANQTWDMSGLELGVPTSATISYSLPDRSMPSYRDPRLSDATLVSITDAATGSWTYHRIDPTGHYLLGSVTVEDFDRDGLKDTLLTTFEPVSTVLPLPLEPGSAWTDSTTQMLEFRGSPPVPVETDVAEHTVEGWGTLLTPHGAASALRIRSDTRVVGAGGSRSTHRTIRFITPVPEGLNVGDTYASGVEIGIDSLGTPLSFAYVAHKVVESAHTDVTFERAPAFSLGFNYPNPFRVETTIPFGLERSGHVRVSVLDVLGRRLAELLNRPMTSGSHRVSWNAEGAPSGLYVVRFQLGASSASQMIILQK